MFSLSARRLCSPKSKPNLDTIRKDDIDDLISFLTVGSVASLLLGGIGIAYGWSVKKKLNEADKNLQERIDLNVEFITKRIDLEIASIKGKVDHDIASLEKKVDHDFTEVKNDTTFRVNQYFALITERMNTADANYARDAATLVRKMKKLKVNTIEYIEGSLDEHHKNVKEDFDKFVSKIDKRCDDLVAQTEAPNAALTSFSNYAAENLELWHKLLKQKE